MPVPWILRAFFTTKSHQSNPPTGKLPYGTVPEEGGGGGTSDLRIEKTGW